MEQFREWWKKNCMEGDWDYEDYAYDAWAAALEWALSRIKDGSISYEQSHIEIEQELGDT